MKVALTPVRWLIFALVVYLFYKSPQTMSDILGDLGRLFVAVGNILEKAIDDVPVHGTRPGAHQPAVHPSVGPTAGAALAYAWQLVMP
jgi:hypothetical protein